jgi:acetyl esterase/lipase
MVVARFAARISGSDVNCTQLLKCIAAITYQLQMGIPEHCLGIYPNCLLSAAAIKVVMGLAGATHGHKRRRVGLLVAAPSLVLGVTAAVRRAGMAVLYKRTKLPEDQIRRNLCYCEGSQDEKHRLDLFLPRGTNWPLMVFIHGGALNSGDKALRVCGADVYGNIGRFYAAHGIGVAVINYRLQPAVTWREQVDDVAQAIAWAYSRMGSFGGDSSRLFVAGHSAGAHLAAHVALDCRPLERLGLSPSILSGVVAASGAALDLTDTKTYELGHRLRHYERRFRCGDPTDAWRKEASPITYVGCNAPPFLIFYAARESKALQRQSQLLHEALQRNGVPSRLVIVPGQNHCRIVLTLSREDRISAQEILKFIGRTADVPCAEIAAA